MPVPGPVALRGRFHLLTDPETPTLPEDAFSVPWEVWCEQVELATVADAALIRNDLDAAMSALEGLRATHRDGLHPLPLVDALVGLGDAARQADRFEQAAEHYELALVVARESGYRFGVVRALVPVGYLAFQAGSAHLARSTFEEAAELATVLDERLYLANALTGLGEAQGRLGNEAEASATLRRALELFESLRSDVGIVNAAQHLGDLCRRHGDLDEALAAFSRAFDVAKRVGPWIGEVNAADGLGEVLLGLGRVEGAISHYRHAYDIALARGYRRGQAHALNGLGRCAVHQHEWANAAALHAEALELYLGLDDLPSAATALGAMARTAEAAGEPTAAVSAAMRAVGAIETMRAVQDRHDDQQEYVSRFGGIYATALRTAVRADDPAAFVSVFENLAGRRLAGLIDAMPGAAFGNAELAAQMLARADNRPSGGEDLRDLPAAERRYRLLGRFALKRGLPDVVEHALAEVGAVLHRPFDPTGAPGLLDDVLGERHILLLSLLPEDEIAWLWATPDRQIRMGIHAVSAATRDVVRTLWRSGLPADACSRDISPLSGLLPPEIGGALVEDDAVLVVPLGELWALPWPALPLAQGYLGERCAIQVLPSLTLAGHLLGSPAPGPVRSVAYWRSPRVRYHEMLAYDDDDERVVAERCADAVAAMSEVVRARRDLVVLTGHGRPVPALGHYLELDADVLLTPTDLLTARTPDRLVLTACWGAHAPGAPAGDPLTLATVALARGSSTVAATTSELADDPLATTFVNQFLYRLLDEPMPHALKSATRRLLASTIYRDGPLSRWAPLVTVGVSRSTEETS